MLAGGGEFGGGCARAPWREAYRHAVDAGKGLEADPGRSRMIPNAFEYATPATLEEALKLVEAGDSKLLAGGMSLIPLMKLRLASPESVIDLGRIPGLNGISESAGVITIGAMSTHHSVETSPLVRGKIPLLAETASRIGDVQVRNMGTIGGSVAHADPAADYPAALVALEAMIHLRSANGDRTVEASEFFI